METTLISGPRKLSDVNYRNQHTGNNKFTVVHFDRLNLCPPNIRSAKRVHSPVPEAMPVEQPLKNLPRAGARRRMCWTRKIVIQLIPLLQQTPLLMMGGSIHYVQDGLQINIRLNVNSRRIH